MDFTWRYIGKYHFLIKGYLYSVYFLLDLDYLLYSPFLDVYHIDLTTASFESYPIYLLFILGVFGVSEGGIGFKD